MDEDEEEDHQTWVEALSQELADEDPEEDPDYEVGALCFLNHNRLEYSLTVHNYYTSKAFKCTMRHEATLILICFQPSTVETESEEYRSHNNTESDLDIQEKGVVIIEDVNTVRSEI